MSVIDQYHNSSFMMSPNSAGEKGYESASGVHDDAAGLPRGSKARFAFIQPELPNINDYPFNAHQAKNIYRKSNINYQA